MALLFEAESALSTFLSEYGYLGPFLVLVACGFGLPVPEEVTMLGSGFLLHQGRVEALPIIAVCWTATLIGDSVPYWIGRRFGRRALTIGPIARILHAERMSSLERRFERSGSRAVFVCRFLPGLRLPAWFTAGTLGMSYPRFLLVDGLGAAIMTPAFIFLGQRSGEKIAELESRVENLHQILGFVVVALAAIIATHLVFNRKSAAGTAPGPTKGAAPGPAAALDNDEPDGDRP